MKCCEEVIVTLKMPWLGQELDMELPCFMPMKELTGKLLETLRLMMPDTFMGVKSIGLTSTKGLLKEEESLGTAGLWDGSVITVVKNRGE